MVTELETLIEEQEAEQRRKNFQPREDFVSFSFQQLTNELGNEIEFDQLTSYNTYRMPVNRGYIGCAIHGRRPIKFKPSGARYCGECDKERFKLNRRLRGLKIRGVCAEHDASMRFVTAQGKTRCRGCTRRNDRAHYWRKKQRGVEAQSTSRSQTYDGKGEGDT